MSHAPDTVLQIPRGEIRPCPFNPRKHFDEQKLNELALNLRKHGVIQPLTVRRRPATDEYPHGIYELICGECRWRGSDERSHPELPERLPAMETLPVLVRELSDADTLEIMLSENMQRQDLTELEQSDAFLRAMAQKNEKGEPVYASVEIFAEKIGVSRQYVQERLRLDRLPKVARKALEEARISFKTARVIVGCPGKIIEDVADVVLNPGKYQIWIGDDYAKAPLNAEQTESEIEQRFVRRLKDAGFDLDDAKLLPEKIEGEERIEGGSCKTCPWAIRAGRGNQENKCLNPACFTKKQEIFAAAELVKAREAGHKILPEKEAERIITHAGNLKYGSGYVDLDEKPCRFERNEKVAETKVPTWEKIVMKGATTPPVVVVQDGMGKVHRLVEHKLAVVAAQENETAHFLNITKGGARSAQQDDYKAQEAKARAEAKLKTVVSLQAMAELVEKVQSSEVPDGFWKWLAEIAAWHGGSDAGNFVVKRRALPGTGHYSDQVKAHGKKLKTDLEQRAFAIELLVARIVKFNGVTDKMFKTVCEMYGVDAGAIDKRLSVEAAQKAKDAAAKKKAAEKKEKAKEGKSQREKKVPVPEVTKDVKKPASKKRAGRETCAKSAPDESDEKCVEYLLIEEDDYQTKVLSLRSQLAPGDKVNVAIIQRKLKSGYFAASMLFDAMAEAGEIREGKLVEKGSKEAVTI